MFSYFAYSLIYCCLLNSFYYSNKIFRVSQKYRHNFYSSRQDRRKKENCFRWGVHTILPLLSFFKMSVICFWSCNGGSSDLSWTCIQVLLSLYAFPILFQRRGRENLPSLHLQFSGQTDSFKFTVSLSCQSTTAAYTMCADAQFVWYWQIHGKCRLFVRELPFLSQVRFL